MCCKKNYFLFLCFPTQKTHSLSLSRIGNQFSIIRNFIKSFETDHSNNNIHHYGIVVNVFNYAEYSETLHCSMIWTIYPIVSIVWLGVSVIYATHIKSLRYIIGLFCMYTQAHGGRFTNAFHLFSYYAGKHRHQQLPEIFIYVTIYM